MWENIVIRDATSCHTDIDFLYDILISREKRQEPGFSLPTYEDHTRYILSNPYVSFKITLYKNIPICTAWLSRDLEVGLYNHYNNVRECAHKLKNIDISSTTLYACLSSAQFPNFRCSILHTNTSSHNCARRLWNFKDMNSMYSCKITSGSAHPLKPGAHRLYEFRKN